MPTYDPTEGMSGTDKFLAGAGKAMVDVGRGVRQYLPNSMGGLSNDDIAEARRLDAPLMKTGAGTAGNIVGNVAMAAPIRDDSGRGYRYRWCGNRCALWCCATRRKCARTR